MPSFWQLAGFEDALDTWIATEDPTLDLRFVVTEWVVGRADDPYVGVRRHPDVAPNYWFATVPGSRERDAVVVCGYWIDEDTRPCDATRSPR